MNIAKAEIVSQPVVRLTIELSNAHAAELAGLLGNHVSFADFPWARAVHNALISVGIRGADVFRGAEFVEHAFLERRDEATELRGGCQCAICLGGSE